MIFEFIILDFFRDVLLAVSFFFNHLNIVFFVMLNCFLHSWSSVSLAAILLHLRLSLISHFMINLKA